MTTGNVLQSAPGQWAIVYPLMAMVLLAMVVAGLLLRERIQEMKSRRIHPSKVATSSQMASVLQNTRAADNYKNLFEMPVLFYLLCAVLLATQQVTPGFVAAAWAYVILRVVHSFIHIGYNNVMHRFSVFALSSTLLLGMWVALLLKALGR